MSCRARSASRGIRSPPPGGSWTAETRRISLGRVNGRRFAFAAGIGLAAEVVRRVDRRGRTEEGGRAGNVMFAWTVVNVVAERRGRFEPALEIEGRGRAAFALVANCDPFTYAGSVPVHVAPEARFELGLDLCAPRAVTPLAIPRLLAGLAPRLVYGIGRDARGDTTSGTPGLGAVLGRSGPSGGPPRRFGLVAPRRTS